MYGFANPGRFLCLAKKTLPWTATFTIVTLMAGVLWGLLMTPADYQLGGSVHIMYVFLPSAWAALFVYTVIAAASAVALIWRHPMAYLAAKASSPIGAGFTFLALVTGLLWGKPMWGTWWIWDASFVSMLVLLFLYFGHMALIHAFEDQQRGYRSAAILILVGFINVPIVKASVDWWNTLHQPASVFRAGGLSIDSSMLLPLLLMAIGFKLYYLTLLIMRIESELVAARLRALDQKQLGTIEG